MEDTPKEEVKDIPEPRDEESTLCPNCGAMGIEVKDEQTTIGPDGPHLYKGEYRCEKKEASSNVTEGLTVDEATLFLYFVALTPNGHLNGLWRGHTMGEFFAEITAKQSIVLNQSELTKEEYVHLSGLMSAMRAQRQAQRIAPPPNGMRVVPPKNKRR